MIGLVLALSLAVQEPPAAPWENIRLDGWTYFSDAADGSLLMFTQPARGDGVRAWVRYEYAEANSYGARSMRTLNEFDCREGRIRTLQWEWFDQSNLTGTGRTVPQDGEWKYPAPNTLGEGHFLLMCPDTD